MRKRLALFIAMVGLIVGVGVAYATLTPQAVRTSQAQELFPAAAYTSRARPSSPGRRTPVRTRAASTPTSSEEATSP